MKRVAASGAAVAVMWMAFAAGAAEKFVIALPNGYEMARVKSGAAAILKRRGSVVVPGPIKSYTVLREVVVGELDVPGAKDADRTPSVAATAAPPAAEPPAPAAPAAAPAAATPAAPTAGSTPAGGAPGGGRPRGGGGAASAPSGDAAANPVFTRPLPSPNGRYFVLDTKTGEVGKDLSLSEWEERLKKYDITVAPALAAPILPK